jgi:hypothetical protein
MWNVNVGAKALHAISCTRLTITVLRSILNRSSRCRPEYVAEYRRAVKTVWLVKSVSANSTLRVWTPSMLTTICLEITPMQIYQGGGLHQLKSLSKNISIIFSGPVVLVAWFSPGTDTWRINSRTQNMNMIRSIVHMTVRHTSIQTYALPYIHPYVHRPYVHTCIYLYKYITVIHNFRAGAAVCTAVVVAPCNGRWWY